MNKKLVLYLSAFVFALMTLKVGALEYAAAIKTFDQDHVALWLKSSLAEKLSKLNAGVAVIITDDTWEDGCSIIECDFYEKKYRALRADDSTCSVSKAQLLEICTKPALVSYDDKVYLNIPFNEIAAAGVSGSLGQLMAPKLYDIMESLVRGVQPKKIRVKFVSKGNPDLLLLDGVMTDEIKLEDVRSAVKEMLTVEFGRKWKKEHDAKVKKLPRKPPVVFGSRRLVVKRSDGTFEIPREAPPKSKTITWTETVYADGWGTTAYGEHFTMRVPVGVRQCSRVKPLTQRYDYDELLELKKKYEDAIEELKNDKPPEVGDEQVEEVIKSGRFRFIVVK